MNDSGGIGTGLLKWLLVEVVAITGLISIVALGGSALIATAVLGLVALPIVAVRRIVLSRSRFGVRPGIGPGG